MTQQRIIVGDCIAGLRTLPDASVHCCCTSPPYWGLRDYQCAGQIGLEDTPEAYVARMVEVFREVRRVLRDDGTCWVNLGDSYAGGGGFAPDAPCNVQRREMIADGDRKQGAFNLSPRQHTRNKSGGIKPQGSIKPKDLVGIPWRVAFALQADGWWLRQDIIWAKPNPMPESVRDRCTKAHEYVFLLTKSERYFYDAEAVKEAFADERQGNPGRYKWKHGAGGIAGGGPNSLHKGDGIVEGWNTDGKATGRNRRSVWTITTKPYRGAHFAVMPEALVEPCIKAGTSEEGCCPACGTPWERVVERETIRRERPNAICSYRDINGQPDQTKAGVACTTTGWRPACTCGGSPVPCTVLDPFAGSGTTLAVAAELGRNGIGCELNPEYVKLAEQRIDEARGKTSLFNAARCGSSAMGMAGWR